MARQSTTPIPFNTTARPDNMLLRTSLFAGKVGMLGYVPVLPGDSCSGTFGVDFDLAEMPRPLLNGVVANVQAWFVPQPAMPRFAGYDEWVHAFQGTPIKSYLASDREPPKLFDRTTNQAHSTSDQFRMMGLHLPPSSFAHTDLLDAYWLVHNFRKQAHSSKLPLSPYYRQDIPAATKLARAFWPASSRSAIVADYERALVVGSLNLDVIAGQIPVSGLGLVSKGERDTTGEVVPAPRKRVEGANGGDDVLLVGTSGTAAAALPSIFAEMEGQSIGITLADLEKARETQAFAKIRASMAGQDFDGLNRDDTILAHLLQGYNVPEEYLKRPWLLDSAFASFGMIERYATDSGALDQSVSQGRASAQLSINLPRSEEGGVIIYIAEVLPERIDEAGIDPWLHVEEREDLPNALRDTLRPEPVDIVQAERIDARHTNGKAAYGFEPMNNKWRRDFTRLGGVFYQSDPANPFKESRSAIWMTNVVDPLFTEDHYLVPEDFPQDVFADELAPAVEITSRSSVTLQGLTQIGDVLHEANDDYDGLEDASTA